MRLADIPAFLVEDTVRKWRRRAIILAVMGVCALVVLVESFSAARAALAISLGPVKGHLVLAGIFLGVIAVAGLVLWWIERRSATKSEQTLARDQRVGLIAEAIDLGYTLAREFKQPSAAPAPEADSAAPDEAPPEEKPTRPRSTARNRPPPRAAETS